MIMFGLQHGIIFLKVKIGQVQIDFQSSMRNTTVTYTYVVWYPFFESHEFVSNLKIEIAYQLKLFVHFLIDVKFIVVSTPDTVLVSSVSCLFVI